MWLPADLAKVQVLLHRADLPKEADAQTVNKIFLELKVCLLYHLHHLPHHLQHLHNLLQHLIIICYTIYIIYNI